MNFAIVASNVLASCRFTSPQTRRSLRLPLRAGFVCSVLGGALMLSGCSGGSSGSSNGTVSFRNVATFNVNSAGGSVAEIAATTPNGNGLLYTDSETGRIGYVDISNLSSLNQTNFYASNGEPTSVAVTSDGNYAIGVIAGANEAVVLSLPSLSVVRTISLPGQPDSIAVSPDGRYAAIAIENQRDEDLNGGAMPQTPAGSLFVINLTPTPNTWTTQNLPLNLPSNLRFPTDPEPEFVDINARNQAVVTLQENNGFAIVNLSSGSISYHDAGTTTHPADTQDNNSISFTDTLTDARREPDGVRWTPRGNLVMANEGDYDVDLSQGQFVGGRNFTVFSTSGNVLFDEQGDMERAVAEAGLYKDNRSDAKGTEPENVEVARIGGRNYLFVALERADALVTYDFTNETQPRLLQVLPTGSGSRPEGVTSVPARNLVITANEGNGTISFFTP